MTKRIALVHAVPVAMAPIAEAFAALWPAADCVDILDDSLARDREREARLTPQMFQRFDALGNYARLIGADGVLFTCSAFGEAIDQVARRSPLPVLRPNEAMFEEALGHGARIGMLATFAPSVAGLVEEFNELARQRGKACELRAVCVPEAGTALRQGDAETHNALLADAAAQLAGVDAIMLAHFSTARAERAVAAQVKVPVLTSPGAAVRKLKACLGG